MKFQDIIFVIIVPLYLIYKFALIRNLVFMVSSLTGITYLSTFLNLGIPLLELGVRALFLLISSSGIIFLTQYLNKESRKNKHCKTTTSAILLSIIFTFLMCIMIYFQNTAYANLPTYPFIIGGSLLVSTMIYWASIIQKCDPTYNSIWNNMFNKDGEEIDPTLKDPQDGKKLEEDNSKNEDTLHKSKLELEEKANKDMKQEEEDKCSLKVN